MIRLMEVIQPLDRETNAVLLEYEVKSAATESRFVSRIVTYTQISVVVTRVDICYDFLTIYCLWETGQKQRQAYLKAIRVW